MLRANLRLNRQFKTKTNEEMTKRGIIFLFNNTEECEFVIPTDVLRRAGVDLKIVGVEESLKPIKGCQNIVISPEEELSKCENELYDVVVLPGGPGADNLSHEAAVGRILKKHFEANKIVAAICGGTKLLKSFNVAKGKRITTFPKYREDLEHGYQIQDKNVEIDENLITSQGPATAFDFAFSIVGQLFGAEKMNQIAEQIGFNSVIKREQ